MRFYSAVIFVQDIDASKSFYCDLLEMEVEHDFGKNVMLKNGFAIWELSDNHEISQNLNVNEDVNKLELYFESHDLDSVYDRLQQHRVRFLHPIKTEAWGQRTFRFFDPDNHLLEVGEPLEVFIKRFSAQGLKPEQISERSGVPLETVQMLLSS